MWCFARRLQPASRRVLLPVLLLSLGSSAFAGSPDWLREVARQPLPSYPDDVKGVTLLDEQITTVNDKGEIKTVHRGAYKILRNSGRELGKVVVFYDSSTKLTFLKAWSIPPQGNEYEVKEKEAVEMNAFDGELYNDDRMKFIQIPGSDPGAVVGFEYEQKHRPDVLQDYWTFQDTIPVRKSRYVLNLPSGWEIQTAWANHAKMEPTISGNQYVWEVNDLPAVKHEPGMPARRAVIGKMAVSFFSPSLRDKAQISWKEVGTWADQLASSRRVASPDIQAKTKELVARKTDFLEKVRALGAFAQRDVRYVAIEVGIGGFQPHMATDIYANRYGDCKDKVTLLMTMLKEAGINSYYLLVHTDRGVVKRELPSPWSFNHVITAIEVPSSFKTDGLYSIYEHPRLSKLMIFDPTSDFTPAGYIPPSEQGSSALLVTGQGGELIDLPLQPPAANQLIRTAKLRLTADGGLAGDVTEVRTGEEAIGYRAELLSLQVPQRIKKMENFLASFLNGFSVKDYTVDNLNAYDKELVVKYSFVSTGYAKNMGSMLLVRPRVFGSKSEGIIDLQERKFPFELEAPTLQTDEFDIQLPAGYTVDELPPPTDVKAPEASYTSSTKFENNTIQYKREFKIEQVMVPLEKLGELNGVYRQIIADERNSAVLKKVQ
jgi:hypothetical protein